MADDITWQEQETHQARAREKYKGLRAKIEAALNRPPVPEGVFDHTGQEIDYLLTSATKTSCLIKKPMDMMEGNGIPGFHVYHDWKQRVEIVLAPNKAKRKAYLTLFPDAEAID